MLNPSSVVPLVAVFKNRSVQGIDHLGEHIGGRELATVVPINVALVREWNSDAHFLPAILKDATESEIEQGWPRFNTAVLPQIRKHGRDLVIQVFLYDVDNDPHVPHSVETFEDFVLHLDNLAHHLRPAAYYTTKKGGRLVYILDEPLPADDAERAHRGFSEVLREAGCPVDPNCHSNWTRLYRCPKVVRDDEQSSKDPFFLLHMQNLDARLPAADLPRRGAKKKGTGVVPVAGWNGEMPTPEEAGMLLTYGGRETEFYKGSRKVLSTKVAGSIIYEAQPIGTTGNRDNNLFAVVRQTFKELMASRMRDLATPPRVFALLLKAVQQLEPDNDTKDWIVNLWQKCCREWQYQLGELEAQKQEAEEVEQGIKNIDVDIVEAMREIYNGQVPTNEAEGTIWVQRHALAVLPGGRFFCLRPDGKYHAQVSDSRQLQSVMRVAGTTEIIQTQEMTSNGIPRLKTQDALVHHYGTPISSVKAVVAAEYAHIRGIDTDEAMMVIPAFRLNPNLKPDYHNEVDGWLRCLAGDDYNTLEQWLVRALDFTAGPICALSLSGPPSVGKKLLVRGLSECLNTSMYCTEADVGDYQTEAVLKTCFMVFDEEIPPVRQLSGIFRRLVAGEEMIVNQKYQTPVRINNPMRIIITANHQDLIHEICGDRQLSQMDQKALAMRILHIDAHQDAADLLNSLGGLTYTGRNGERWVAGDAGQASNYIVAQHFLWLYTNRPREPLGKRLLMEGNVQEMLMKEMRTKGGVAPDVLRILAWMIDSKDISVPIVLEDGEVFITAAGVETVYNSQFRSGLSARLNTKNISRALDGIADPATDNALWKSLKNGQRQKARWRRVWLRDLLDYSLEVGLPNSKLSEMVDKHPTRGR